MACHEQAHWNVGFTAAKPEGRALFDAAEQPDGTFAFKSCHGMYMSERSGSMAFDSDTITANEKITLSNFAAWMVSDDWQSVLGEYLAAPSNPNQNYLWLACCCCLACPPDCVAGYTATITEVPQAKDNAEPIIQMELSTCGGNCPVAAPPACLVCCCPCNFVPQCRARWVFMQDRRDKTRYKGTLNNLCLGGFCAERCAITGNEITVESGGDLKYTSANAAAGFQGYLADVIFPGIMLTKVGAEPAETKMPL